jgi:predicted dehydrogenase
MTTRPTVSRRSFMTRAAAMATISIVPRHVLGQGKLAPSEMITSANIGLGGPARGVGCDVVLAKCDVRRDKLGGAPDPKKGLYLDFRDVLARDDIDAVAIGSTEQWHAIQIIAALKAGKDVFGEKPMSSTIREASAIRKAVKRYGRIFQHGTQRTSSKIVQYARHLVEQGRLGKITAAGVGDVSHNVLARQIHYPAQAMNANMLDWDMWLGPAPYRPYNNFIMGGVLGWHSHIDFGRDMVNGGAIHPNDAVRHVLGYETESPVTIHPPDGKDYTSTTTWTYADGTYLQVGFEGLPIPDDLKRMKAPYCGPFAIIGTEGKIFFASMASKFIWSDPPELAQGLASFQMPHNAGHYKEWHNCIRTRERPISNEDAAYQSEFLCHSSEIAQRLGRPLKWDAKNEAFLDDVAANRLMDKPYRGPWHI